MSWRQALSRTRMATFVAVMATEVVSVAASQEGHVLLAWGLYILGAACYGTLWLAMLMRLAIEPAGLWRELASSPHPAGPFNLVTGTCVLGIQVMVLSHAFQSATVLWAAAGCLWLGSSYALFASLMIGAHKPELAGDIHVGWLLVVVSVQALAILGGRLAPFVADPERVAAIALGCHLLGVMLYAFIMPLILNRLIFFCVSPEALTPLSWVNMGAIASSGLAASVLAVHSVALPMIRPLVPFLEAESLMFWSGATWWIPLLVIFGVWRHAVRRYPFAFTSEYWGVVYPLGTYTVCSRSLYRAGLWPFMGALAGTFFWASLVAWVLVATGMLNWARQRLRV